MSVCEKNPIVDNTNLINYLPPELHLGKETYIDFYITRPGEKKLYRKRIKLNRQKRKLSTNDFRRYTRQLIKKLNEKLAAGWNPFIEENSPRGFTRLSDALDLFMRSRARDMKENSIRSYRSFIFMLKTYCSDVLQDPDILIITFDRLKARDYLNAKYISGEISSKTYNNYILAYHSIWSWFVENGYTGTNVFSDISRKKTRAKFRNEIPEETRYKIRDFLTANGENAYWLICELCFWGLIRPAEICRIKTKNVFPDDQIIILEASETKNDQERTCSLPGHVSEMVREHLSNGSGTYLFSDELFMPGNKKSDPRKISKRWDRLRNELNFSKNIQFYSLRDSGIIKLLGMGINPEFVRAQADHFSLEMTTKYTNHYRPEGIEDIKKLSD